MPTYDYRCNQCQKSFSVSLTMAEHDQTPLPACEHCGSKNVTQLLAEVNVITSKKS